MTLTIKKIIKKTGSYVLEFEEVDKPMRIMPNETVRCLNRVLKFYHPHFLKVGDKIKR